MITPFHISTLPSATNILVDKLQEQKPDFLQTFYLSGGTSLSLQLGHRQSEDLDFFSQTVFDPIRLQPSLTPFGTLTEIEIAEGTLNAFINDVKVQFLHYPYQLLKPVIKWENIQLSSVEDIACTKLQTISMRGSKKDFIDLYFLLKEYTLPMLFNLLEKKYREIQYNQTHILKSLVYFVDAEKQPMPRMIKRVDWDQVKFEIITAVKSFKFE